MRFHVTIASVLILALASSSSMVAAQYLPPVASPACQTCLTAAMRSIGNCKEANFNPINIVRPAELNPAKLQCFCTLWSGASWAYACSTDTTCGKNFGSDISSGFSADKQKYCQGVNTGGAGNSSTTENSASTIESNAKAIGFAMALAAAFAHELL
ncbi:hypothetical protein BGZ93_010821 [Podila epicladia]|nr:hypothetical protein BGZ93_010821 [Podila epicladia]KAG0091530.1 hypothetical protein BGZ92_000484 [Podila epicladia]